MQIFIRFSKYYYCTFFQSICAERRKSKRSNKFHLSLEPSSWFPEHAAIFSAFQVRSI